MMFRMQRKFALLIFWLAISLSSAAQTPDMARLEGDALDQSRAALPGVEVKLVNRLTSAERGTTTDAAGHFAFSGLPIGAYIITARKQGFSALDRDITLVGGATATVRLQLNVSG